jgi:hypothetical protein
VGSRRTGQLLRRATLLTREPGVRIRKWAYDDSPGIYPGPLQIIGQTIVPLADCVRTGHWTIHTLRILMGMKIVSSDPGEREPAGACRQRMGSDRLLATRPVQPGSPGRERDRKLHHGGQLYPNDSRQ